MMQRTSGFGAEASNSLDHADLRLVPGEWKPGTSCESSITSSYQRQDRVPTPAETANAIRQKS